MNPRYYGGIGHLFDLSWMNMRFEGFNMTAIRHANIRNRCKRWRKQGKR